MHLIVSTIIGILLLAVAWYYVPEPTRNKVVTFTGKAAEQEPGRITELAKEEFLPKDPVEKREILIGELKKNVESIKTGTDIPKSIIEAEKLLAELELVNKEKPIASNVLNRALDLVLPSKAQECVPTQAGTPK